MVFSIHQNIENFDNPETLTDLHIVYTTTTLVNLSINCGRLLCVLLSINSASPLPHLSGRVIVLMHFINLNLYELIQAQSNFLDSLS